MAAQNLWLVSIKRYNGLWASVWRSGSDGYYLWIDADQANFLVKWRELAAQGLRLIDFDVYTVNGQTLWAGVWRAGTDGYYHSGDGNRQRRRRGGRHNERCRRASGSSALSPRSTDAGRRSRKKLTSD